LKPWFALEADRGQIADLIQGYQEILQKIHQLYEAYNLHTSDLKDKTCFYYATVDQEHLLKRADARLWNLAINSSEASRVLASEGESKLTPAAT